MDKVQNNLQILDPIRTNKEKLMLKSKIVTIIK